MKTRMFILSMCISLFGFAQNYNLTFRVDMSEEATIDDTVCVVGDFQLAAGFPSDWDPGTTIMTDPNMDQIYEITVSLPAGTYTYKFVNGAFWGLDEGVPGACAVAGNRQVVLNSNMTLPIVCFGSCSECASATNFDLTFKVDMSEESSISDTVSVVGSFQAAAGYLSDWTPGTTIMTDPDLDQIYEVTVSLPAGSYQYKFVNGTEWGLDEGVPGACAVLGNREVTISATTVLDVVCFSSCTPCDHIGLAEEAFPFTVSFANGNTNELYILFNESYSGRKKLELVDFMGRKIQDIEIEGMKAQISLEGLNSGLYFIRLLSGEKEFIYKILRP